MGPLTPDDAAVADAPGDDLSLGTPQGHGADAPTAAPAVAVAAAAVAVAVAMLEAIDRDGSVRQAWRIEHWPVSIGRALDNDIVIGDPHVAAHHARIDFTAAGDTAPAAISVSAGETRNGLAIGRRLVVGGETARLVDVGRDLDLHVGRSTLRLRLPGHALLPEQALAPIVARDSGWLPTIGLGLLVIACVLLGTYIDNDPDGLARAIATAIIGTLGAGALWCGFWALLSKIFARQSSFAWHVRVFVIASLAGVVLGVVPALVAFAFSWPWVADFTFVAVFATVATTIYFHLLAVEPGRQRLMRAVVATGFVVGVAVAVWFNIQRTGRPGEELYMNHLFSPFLRVARPVPVDRFVERLGPMQAILDRQAKDPHGADSDSRPTDDDED